MTALAAEIEAGAAPVLERRGADRIRRLAVFDAGDYLALNPDLAGVEPFEHFSDHGVWERRPRVGAERLTAKLARAVRLAPLGPLDAGRAERAYRHMDRLSPSVHLPAAASEREALVAHRIVLALDSIGLACPIVHGLPGGLHTAPILIDAATLFDGVQRETAVEAVSGAVVMAMGFPAEADFAAQLPYLLAAGGVAAEELETYALFAGLERPAFWFGAPALGSVRKGLPDHPLVPGLSRAVRAAPGDLPWSERPIDVLALDSASAARSAAWSRMIEGMTRFATVYHAPPADLPSTAELRSYLYARSKIVLHLHESAPTTLGAQLTSEVAGSGAVLLTEPSLPHRLLRPDIEYFESSARRMPERVEALVNGPGGAEIATRCAAALHRAVSSAFAPEDLGLGLVSTLLDAQEAPR